MSKLITTVEISYNIEKLIKESKKRIVLVTPYIKLHNRLKKLLLDKIVSTDVQIIIVCRQSDANDIELKNFKNKPTVRIFYSNELHAKAYLNESLAILTSMNLYEYSMVNNVEFGILLGEADQEYNDLMEECKRISSRDIFHTGANRDGSRWVNLEFAKEYFRSNPGLMA